MSSQTKVTAVEPLAERWLRVTFADGAIHEVDLGPLLAVGGAFAPIRDEPSVFEAVSVDAEFGTVVWPGGIDLDPDVLRGEQEPASGVKIPRRVIQPA
jgi:Protein of unknown function (DUF2442)